MEGGDYIGHEYNETIKRKNTRGMHDGNLAYLVGGNDTDGEA